MKLSPVKDRAAAKVFDAVLTLFEVVPDVTLERLVDEEFVEGDLLWTESCRLFARAFSCWRINCAND